MPVIARVKNLWRRLTGPFGRDVIVVSFSSFTVALPAALMTWGDHDLLRGLLTLVVGAVAVVALWWRRRFPIAVTLITGAACVGMSIFVPVCFALATLAVRRRDWTLAALTFFVALCLAAPFAWHRTWDYNQLIVGAFAAAAFALFGAYVGARRDLLFSLRERAEKAEQERELRADQARLSERGRIAREMHDVLAHKVSLIALHAGALEVNPARPPAEVEQAAGLIRLTARATLEDLRGVLGVLRSTDPNDAQPLAPQPTLADLERLVADSQAAGVAIELTADPMTDVPDLIGRTAYRVVQEALTNVHKHARGARTAVTVQRSADELTITVTNLRPVASGSLLPGSGAGLPGLTERVALAGGSLVAGPTEAGGWQVHAVLPCPGFTAPSTAAPSTVPLSTVALSTGTTPDASSFQPSGVVG